MHTNEYACHRLQQQATATQIAKHVKVVAKDGMFNTAKKSGMPSMLGEDDVLNCGVSCDGTWQKRAYSSQNGCVIIMTIDTGEALDVEPLTKVCKQCQHHSH